VVEAHLSKVFKVDLKSEIEIAPVFHRLPERTGNFGSIEALTFTRLRY
jgi:hypothetical protein